jgi:hypothetical protein
MAPMTYSAPKSDLLFLASHSGRWMSKFALLSDVYLAATAVSGQLHELRRSTTTSPQTIAASHCSGLEMPERRSDWKREDAGSEERPDCGVRELDDS